MKRNFTFLGKIAIAILLVFGMTVSGCKKEPLPGDGSEVVKPGDGDEDGDGKEDGDGDGDGDNPSEQQSMVTVKASGVALTSVVFIGNSFLFLTSIIEELVGKKGDRIYDKGVVARELQQPLCLGAAKLPVTGHLSLAEG